MRIIQGHELTRLLGMAVASLDGEPVEDILQDAPRGRRGDSR
jgi:hypothetical protein